MKGGVVLIALFLHASFFLRAEEPPRSPEPGSFEIEPPLLPGNLSEPATPPASLDLVQAERKFARAKQAAAGAERLFRMGVLAKAEAENRALRMMRAETEWARARVAAAQTDLNNAMPGRESEGARRTLAELQQAAEIAAAKERNLELELAAINVRRQQKLLALGSGAHSAVGRAQDKLDRLQSSGE